MSPAQEQHPSLSGLVVSLAAPVQVWSQRDGQVLPVGAQGGYCGDDRVLDRIEVRGPSGPWRARSADVFTTAGQTRTRVVTPASLAEEYSADRPTRWVVALRTDATPMGQVRRSQRVEEAPGPDSDLAWSWRPGTRAVLVAPEAQVRIAGREVTLTWPSCRSARWELRLEDTTSPVVAAEAGPAWPVAPGALGRLLSRSSTDAGALRMSLRSRPGSPFLAAGAPWYLTLFGRDALLSAMLLGPVDPALALGTLRALASLQGSRRDPDAAEEPGKILHELRGASLDLGSGIHLPPAYFGTVDATPLWIRLLHAVWRTGAEVGDLWPHLHRALDWIAGFDGFLTYHDATGHGLANQGWKDSPDAIRHADGSLATGPIALVEVQGYAYAAARAAAEMLEAHGEDGTAWRARAARLRDRFHASYWVDGFPALALDGAGRPVASLSSDVGHLLGTGLLDADQARAVADLLLSPALFSGYGVRTLAADHPAYDPVSYHRGSVWTHDTAVAIDGLLAEGLLEPARTLAGGLLRAAEGLDFRLPELFSGRTADAGPPADYPTSCRPQAWAVASAVPIARALGVNSSPEAADLRR